MFRVVAITIAVLLAVSLGVSGAMAQAPPPKTEMPKTDKPMEQKTDKMGQKLEGKIKSVGPNGLVTLEDGTKLSVPASVGVSKAQLKAGATIVAAYEEKGGQKVATSVQIKE